MLAENTETDVRRRASSPTPSSDAPAVASSTKRVLLVDAHPLLRSGLKTLIEQERDFMVCGEADRVDVAIAAAGTLRPHVVVLDISLANGKGLHLIADIKRACPRVALLVFSAQDEAIYGERASRAGSSGYISKQQPILRVVAAIRVVAGGGTVSSGLLKAQTCQHSTTNLTQGESSTVARLSPRELQVFRLIGEGKATREIAHTLQIGICTIAVYRRGIKAKLGLNSGNELLQHALHFAQQPVAVAA